MWVLGALPVVVVTSAIAWYLASKHPTAEPATSGASATPAAKAAPRAAASAQSAPAVLDLEPARALAGAPELARAPAPASAALQRADTDPLFAPGSGDATPHRAYPQNVADRPIPRIGEEPWLVSDEWRTHHERLLQAPNRARAEVVFLGDSITEGWQMTPAYRERFGKYSPLDLGIAGDHTQHLLWRIEQGELDGIQPAVAVVMIGVNNLAGGFTPENTAAGVRAVVRAVRTHLPAASVLVLAVLPARHEPDDPLRHKINDTNRLLAGLAEPGKVSVHDVGSVFLDADGTISKSVMRDFLHPTGAGYALLSDAVAPLIEGALASRPKQ